MNRSVLLRLVALVVTVLVGFGYILFDVLGVRVGAQPFGVTVLLDHAGGIYTEAEVTYRGVDVGKVTSLHLSRNGVAVHLAIKPGTHIPANSPAAVRELSAAGEQYMDLVPTSPSGPDLHSGSVIALRRTSVPVSIDTTLIDFGQLLSSVNTSDIQALNRELSSGFGGAGGQFRTLIADTTNLFDALKASQSGTVSLQVGGHKVLKTFISTNGDFSSFTTSLNALTGQFKSSDKDLGALFVNGAAAQGRLHTVLTDDSANIEKLISGFGTLSDVAYARNPAVRALFQALPSFVSSLAAVTGTGGVNTELYFNTASTVCPYLSTQDLIPPTQKVTSANLGLQCDSSAPDLLQRGAAHAPVPAGG
jgi:phospholipid/cholesterol/gamma-HCH transport system substrate-binding protein